jgi:hypothetical protein
MIRVVRLVAVIPDLLLLRVRVEVAAVARYLVVVVFPVGLLDVWEEGVIRILLTTRLNLVQ